MFVDKENNKSQIYESNVNKLRVVYFASNSGGTDVSVDLAKQVHLRLPKREKSARSHTNHSKFSG